MKQNFAWNALPWNFANIYNTCPGMGTSHFFSTHCLCSLQLLFKKDCSTAFITTAWPIVISDTCANKRDSNPSSLSFKIAFNHICKLTITIACLHSFPKAYTKINTAVMRSVTTMRCNEYKNKN